MNVDGVARSDRSPVAVLHDEGFDVLLYKGGIHYPGFDQVVHQCPDTRRDNILLVLVTLGGEIDAAYRIVSYLRENYTKVTVLVPGMCKSAGTLVCVGAHELVIGDSGELGPLDVQVREKGELFSFHSGLAIRQALDSLQAAIRETLRMILVDASQFGGLGTERSAEIAIRTAVGAFGPIYGQINPERLGEVDRMVMVAGDYAARLQGNLRDGALGELVLGYSSHSFAIDRNEATALFEVVRKPSEAEIALARYLSVDKISAAFLAPETEVRYIEDGPQQGSVGGEQRGDQQADQANRQEECERRDPQSPAGTYRADDEGCARVVQEGSDAGSPTSSSTGRRADSRGNAEQGQMTTRDARSA